LSRRRTPPDPRAVQLEWAGLRGIGGRPAPLADPTASAPGAVNRVDRPLDLVRGKVVDAIPYLHAYKVHLEGVRGALVCTAAVATPCLPIGVRTVSSYAAGADVLVARAPGEGWGLIVGAIPPVGVDPSRALPDWVHMTSRCGALVDRDHEPVLRCSGAGGLRNWSGGRPVDSLAGVEAGWMAETGVRILLDPFHAQVAADEATGLFVFHHDQAARLAAPHLQLFSAGHVEESMDDEGEVLLYRGWTPYPWEQLGALRPGVDPLRDVPDGDVQGGAPHYASVEPSRDDQAPFHRRVFLGGYAGQGGKDLVLAPPRSGDVFSRGAAREAAPADLPAALLEEQRTLAGAYLLRAAGGLYVGKQAAIPAPVRVRRPEDRPEAGEAPYAAAGREGPGGPHRVAAAVAASVDADPGLQRAAGVLDRIAHLRNWEAQHALHLNGGDWRVPEEAEGPLGPGYEPPPYAALADEFALPDPPSAKVKVDDRYGEVEFHRGEAGLFVGEDGSIVLRDAWGSSIVMSHGRIGLQPASDLFAQPGRNFLVWAGRDASIRARNHAELTCSLGDLRLKAERNLQALAGNSGEGALLLESRGVEAMDYEGKLGDEAVGGGVQIKAAAGPLQAWGSSLYLRSLEGDVVLDAARGGASVVSLGARVEAYARDGVFGHLGSPADVSASAAFDASGFRVGAGLSVSGPLAASGGASISGDVNIVGGHVFSDRARESPEVGSYPDPAFSATVRDAVRDAGRASRADARAGSSRYGAGFANGLYAAGGAGSDAAIRSVGFSFRTTERCGAAKFACWEASWQQAARESGAALDAWSEPPVAAPGGGPATAPFPGAGRLIREPAYYEQALKLYDVPSGAARPRGELREDYERPRFAEVTPVPIDGRYPVIPPPSAAAGGDGGAPDDEESDEADG